MSVIDAFSQATKAFSQARKGWERAMRCPPGKDPGPALAKALARAQDAEQRLGAAVGTSPPTGFTRREIDKLAKLARAAIDDARGLVKRAEAFMRACAWWRQFRGARKQFEKAVKDCDAARARFLADMLRDLEKKMEFEALLWLRPKVPVLEIGKYVVGLERRLRKLAKCTKKRNARRGGKIGYTPCGTFAGTTAGTKAVFDPPVSGSDGSNMMEFKWRPGKDCGCENACVVSVRHFVNISKGGKVVRKMGEASSAKGAMNQPLNLDGYAVDVHELSKCPCWGDGMIWRAHFDSAGSGKVEGLAGFDPPTDLDTRGPDVFESHFETAVMCCEDTADGPKIAFLQSMRWRLWWDAKANRKRVSVIHNGKKVDWGRPSPPFERAVKDWIKVRKFKKCCPRDHLKPLDAARQKKLGKVMRG